MYERGDVTKHAFSGKKQKTTSAVACLVLAVVNHDTTYSSTGVVLDTREGYRWSAPLPSGSFILPRQFCIFYVCQPPATHPPCARC